MAQTNRDYFICPANSLSHEKIKIPIFYLNIYKKRKLTRMGRYIDGPF